MGEALEEIGGAPGATFLEYRYGYGELAAVQPREQDGEVGVADGGGVEEGASSAWALSTQWVSWAVWFGRAADASACARATA